MSILKQIRLSDFGEKNPDDDDKEKNGESPAENPEDIKDESNIITQKMKIPGPPSPIVVANKDGQAQDDNDIIPLKNKSGIVPGHYKGAESPTLSEADFESLSDDDSADDEDDFTALIKKQEAEAKKIAERKRRQQEQLAKRQEREEIEKIQAEEAQRLIDEALDEEGQDEEGNDESESKESKAAEGKPKDDERHREKYVRKRKTAEPEKRSGQIPFGDKGRSFTGQRSKVILPTLVNKNKLLDTATSLFEESLRRKGYLTPGSLFEEKYLLAGKVGSKLYRAKKFNLEEDAKERTMDDSDYPYFVKILDFPESFLDDKDLMEALKSKYLYLFEQRNIIGYHDFGRTQDKAYVVMDAFEGISLQELMDHDQKISEENLTFIAYGITKALMHMEKNQVTHNGIEPDRIMLNEEGEIKLLDIAPPVDMKAYKEQEEKKNKYRLISGNPFFVSPEQVKAKAFDIRSDVYSLGAVLYYCLSKKVPIDGDTRTEIFDKKLNEKAEKLDADVKEELSELIMQMLDPDIEKRPDPKDLHKTFLQLLS